MYLKLFHVSLIHIKDILDITKTTKLKQENLILNEEFTLLLLVDAVHLYKSI